MRRVRAVPSQVVRLGRRVANGVDVLERVLVQVQVGRVGGVGRGDGVEPLVVEAVRCVVLRRERPAGQWGDQERSAPVRLDVVGEVLEVSLVLVQGDVGCGFLGKLSICLIFFPYLDMLDHKNRACIPGRCAQTE